MIRRICCFGGPSCGKSTTAARLFGELKRQDHDIELVQEYVKEWAYQNRKPISFDQIYLFGKQIHAEDVRLQHVKQIITDSPLLLSAAYSILSGFDGYQEIINLAKKFEEVYPSINIILDRTGIEYVDHGRYQNYAEALEVDKLINDVVYSHAPRSSIHRISALDFEGIQSLVTSYVN